LKTRRRRRCRRIFFNLRDPYPPPFFPLQVREKICSDLFFLVVVSTLLLFCYSRREREREREVTLSVSGKFSEEEEEEQVQRNIDRCARKKLK
jgi:hypothetical protein